MDIFSKLVFYLSETPAWVYLVGIPLCALVSAILLALFRARRAYPPVAAGLVLFGFALIASRGEWTEALVYLGLTGALFTLFALFLLLPSVRRRKKESREERIYRRFRTESEEPVPDTLPPKVCCYETPATAEESGMRLTYVASLITKLKTCKLTPSDRLELEALGHAVDGCRGKVLTQEELGSLNDALASVLKLTAKYKL